MNTPVAFLVFNRPDTTRRVFDAIAATRPTTLLVVADGPRADRAGEAERCRAVRAIIDRVDWPCEVLRNYSDTNLGCRNRVSSGIDWVFSQVEEAIILEDDCLPCPDFFPFCTELLDRYRTDTRVMHISGSNVQTDRQFTNDSYYFSRYPVIWGWATWRRAWRHYDVDIASWPQLRDTPLFDGLFVDPVERCYFLENYERFHSSAVDTWDVQWTYACWCQSGLAINPEVNLISNIGFGSGATHTHDAASPLAGMATGSIGALRHPALMMRQSAADLRYFYARIGGREFREMQHPWRRARMAFGAWRRRAGRHLRGWIQPLFPGTGGA